MSDFNFQYHNDKILQVFFEVNFLVFMRSAE